MRFVCPAPKNCKGAGRGRALSRTRSHCRFALPLIHFLPDSLIIGAPTSETAMRPNPSPVIHPPRRRERGVVSAAGGRRVIDRRGVVDQCRHVPDAFRIVRHPGMPESHLIQVQHPYIFRAVIALRNHESWYLLAHLGMPPPPWVSHCTWVGPAAAAPPPRPHTPVGRRSARPASVGPWQRQYSDGCPAASRTISGASDRRARATTGVRWRSVCASERKQRRRKGKIHRVDPKFAS
jgi:hypothetical protein